MRMGAMVMFIGMLMISLVACILEVMPEYLRVGSDLLQKLCIGYNGIVSLM
jgi:hypothetical protein